MGSCRPFKIEFAAGTHFGRIDLTNEKQFGEITSRLFRGVGVRLLLEMLENLRAGKSYKFGDAVIRDEEIELPVRAMFGKGVGETCMPDREDDCAAGLACEPLAASPAEHLCAGAFEIHGSVIDALDGAPIAGALVLGSWAFESAAGSSCST